MNFYVELELVVDDDGSPLDVAHLDQLVDDVMGQVADLPEDVDLGVDSARSSITFCVSLVADSPRAAVDRADEIATAAMAALDSSPRYTGIGATARHTELVTA